MSDIEGGELRACARLRARITISSYGPAQILLQFLGAERKLAHRDGLETIDDGTRFPLSYRRRRRAQAAPTRTTMSSHGEPPCDPTEHAQPPVMAPPMP